MPPHTQQVCDFSPLTLVAQSCCEDFNTKRMVPALYQSRSTRIAMTITMRPNRASPVQIIISYNQDNRNTTTTFYTGAHFSISHPARLARESGYSNQISNQGRCLVLFCLLASQALDISHSWKSHVGDTSEARRLRTQ